MGMQLSGHCLALCYCRLEVGDTLNEGRERGRKRNSEHVPCSASSLAGIYDLYIVLKGYPLIGSTWSAAPKPFSSLAIWGSHFHFRTHPCNDSLRGPSRPSLAVIFEVGCDREPGWLHLMSLGWLPDSLTGIEDVLWVKQPQWLSFFLHWTNKETFITLGVPSFQTHGIADFTVQGFFKKIWTWPSLRRSAFSMWDEFHMAVLNCLGGFHIQISLSYSSWRFIPTLRENGWMAVVFLSRQP
jgi:hypothetical protein